MLVGKRALSQHKIEYKAFTSFLINGSTLSEKYCNQTNFIAISFKDTLNGTYFYQKPHALILCFNVLIFGSLSIDYTLAYIMKEYLHLFSLIFAL